MIHKFNVKLGSTSNTSGIPREKYLSKITNFRQWYIYINLSFNVADIDYCLVNLKEQDAPRYAEPHELLPKTRYYAIVSGKYKNPIIIPEPQYSVPLFLCQNRSFKYNQSNYPDLTQEEIKEKTLISGILLKEEPHEDSPCLLQTSLTPLVDKKISFTIDEQGTLTLKPQEQDEDGKPINTNKIMLIDNFNISLVDKNEKVSEVGEVDESNNKKYYPESITAYLYRIHNKDGQRIDESRIDGYFSLQKHPESNTIKYTAIRD